MTFVEKYNAEPTWQGKVMIMEIFHLAMTARDRDWTVKQTAEAFGVSVGLTSENLKIAFHIHHNNKVFTAESRQDALKKLSNGRY